MISINSFKEIALSFPQTEEMPHFEKSSFRVKKKIFATVSETNKRACLKLSLIDQSVFCSIDRAIIYPVPNKWGKQGWTLIELSKVKKNILTDALTTAYLAVASKPLSKNK